MNNSDLIKILLANNEASIQNNNIHLSKAPSGSLLSVMRDRKLTYFQSVYVNGVRNRKAINKFPDLISALAQKAYLEAEQVLNEHNQKLLQYISDKYIEPTFENVLSFLPKKYGRIPIEVFTMSPNACTTSSPDAANDSQASFESILPMTFTTGGQKQDALDTWFAALDSSGNSQKVPLHLANYLKNSQTVRIKQIIDTSRYTLDVIKWAEAPYLQSLYKKDLSKVHISSNDLYVRSKSELMLVEKYYHYKIPFHYDEIIVINNEILIPDFILPGKKYPFYFWEHCGMPENPEYMKHHKHKLALYESAGIAPWTNLIVTYDDEYGNFDMQIIESEIRSKLL